MNNDKIRQEKIECYGVKFLRFSEKDILQNLEGVVKLIEVCILKNTPLRSPLKRGIRKCICVT